MKYTSRLLIVLSTFTSGILHRTVCAATTTRLGVSAIVETRCAVKVTPGSEKRKKEILNNCSDDTTPTVSLASDLPAAASNAKNNSGATTSSGNDIGSADVTITY